MLDVGFLLEYDVQTPGWHWASSANNLARRVVDLWLALKSSSGSTGITEL